MSNKERRFMPKKNTEHARIDSLVIERSSPALLAFIIGALALLIGSLFLHNINEKQFAYRKMEAMQQSLVIKEQVIKFVARNNMALQSLRNVILQKQPISEDDFRELSEDIFRRLSYIKLISWAPSGKVQRVYPLGLNKPLINQHVPRPIINQLAQSRDNLTVAVEIRHDELIKFSLHSLLMLDDIGSEFNGVISMDLDLQQFLKMEAFLDNRLSLPFIIKNKNNLKSLMAVKGQSFDKAKNIYTTQIKVGDKDWLIQTLIEETSDFSWLKWLLVVFSSLGLAVISYKIICTYQQRSVDVKAGAYRANYDLLTGLPNRYHFSRRLSETIEESKRTQKDFAVFFMDIDHFKHMNDQIGQGAGDTILTTFAQRLGRVINDNDLMARISGDEFVIIANNVDDVIKADLLAEKLKKNLQHPIDFAGQQHFISVSMGVAMYPIDGEDVASLLHHADQAMYVAKRAGRNRHVFFNESMHEQAESYFKVHEDILRGLADGEFELYYQPIVNLKTEMVDICEALIRWNHPEKGLLLPDSFIVVAERTGAIREIGHWAFSQACRDIRTFIEGDIKVKIAINHSTNEYYSNRAFENWKRVLRENNISGDNFIFEIPETLLMDKKSVRMSVVNAMRKMGVQFAIDDFGTGHSAINYLRNYPVEILKIDSSLINGMLKNDKDKTLVEVVFTLAKSFGKTVVAEGVENDIVAEKLKGMGCDYLQGHLLFEPKPIDRLIPYLHQHMFEIEERQFAAGDEI